METVVVIKQMLDEFRIPCKLWLLHNKTKNKVHTIPSFEAQGKVVYLELTPQSAKPWYGKEIVYDTEQEFLKEYAQNNYDVSDVSNRIIIGEQPHFLCVMAAFVVLANFLYPALSFGKTVNSRHSPRKEKRHGKPPWEAAEPVGKTGANFVLICWQRFGKESEIH